MKIGILKVKVFFSWKSWRFIAIISICKIRFLFLSIRIPYKFAVYCVWSIWVKIKSIFKYWTWSLKLCVSDWRAFKRSNRFSLSRRFSTRTRDHVWKYTQSAFDILSQLRKSTCIFLLTWTWLVFFYFWIRRIQLKRTFNGRYLWLKLLRLLFSSATWRSVSNHWFLDKCLNVFLIKAYLTFTRRFNLKRWNWLVFV